MCSVNSGLLHDVAAVDTVAGGNKIPVSYLNLII